MKNNLHHLYKAGALALTFILALGLTACGETGAASAAASTAVSASASAPASGAVAKPEDMAAPQTVGTPGMTPVLADALKEGTYAVAVDSSSKMFDITACVLTVQDGKMTAVMTMGGTGYLKVFMGTGEEAAKAAESACIPFVEAADGTHTFAVPVEALDKELACAAFSKKKEKWYDRTLVFRADSLPAEAYAAGELVTAQSLDLADGSYTAEVTLAGGSGRASVASPVALRVQDGKVLATIVWGSSNYDYMKVDEQRYELLAGQENSTFEIPVASFDRPLAVIADTVAMSEPHEVSYTLTFDSATLRPAK